MFARATRATGSNMTFRAVLIGLLVGIGLACVGQMNDVWLVFSPIGSDLVPVHAYGFLLLGLLLVNPLLRLVRLHFRPGEWVVMLGLFLMGSVIAGAGLMWVFPHPLLTPYMALQDNPGWARKNLLQYVPPVMMVDSPFRDYADSHNMACAEGENYRAALERGVKEGTVPADDLAKLKEEDLVLVDQYMTGRPGAAWMKVRDLPWARWGPTLCFWYAVLGLTFIAGLAGVVIVHRQWSQREHLSYPIVRFSDELIGPEDALAEAGKSPPRSIFHERGFWVGFAISMGVLLINGYAKYNLNSVSIPLSLDLTGFREMLGQFDKAPGNDSLLKVSFYFSAIGLAYFLTSEASFSLGVSGWLWGLAITPLFVAGVEMRRDSLGGGLAPYSYFGAFVGMTVMVLYLGRRYYWALVRRSVGLGDPNADVLRREIAAFWILLAAQAAMVAILISVGLHWLPAVLYVSLTGMLFLMIGRAHAATGLFIIQPTWHPVGVILAAFGGYALGPQAVVILALLAIVVTLDTRIAVVPLALNILKLGEGRRLKPGWLTGWMGVAVVLAMVIAVPVTIYFIYNVGLQAVYNSDIKYTIDVSREPFNMLSAQIDRLASTGQLEAAKAPTDLGRLMSGRAAPYFWAASGTGLLLVLGCSYLRLRFARWPLHPVIFMVWGTGWMNSYAPSFLAAWLLKTAIAKYGGQKSYRQAKPIFVGLVAGELAAALFWAGVGVLYYWLTQPHTTPPPAGIRPG